MLASCAALYAPYGIVRCTHTCTKLYINGWGLSRNSTSLSESLSLSLSSLTSLSITVTENKLLSTTMVKRSWIRSPPGTLLLLTLCFSAVAAKSVMKDDVWASPTPASVPCTMCSSCENPCQPIPVASPPPPPPLPSPPPPDSSSGECPPPPSPQSPTYYYSPTPPVVYASPPPPTSSGGGGGGGYNPAPSGPNYSGPPPPNPILPYYPFYYYSPPPPSKSDSGAHRFSLRPNSIAPIIFLSLIGFFLW